MLEIACFNTSSAIAAAKAGASRIELCADYASGGVTPSLVSLQEIRANTAKPINVMVRPRAGNFVYTSTEFEQMKEEIRNFKPWASGFVFGILDHEGCVDEVRNRELVDLAKPLPCTFHRAIDEVGDIDEGVEVVIKCGFKSILTSGGEKSASVGAGRIAELQKRAGAAIDIIAGGGVRSTNAAELMTRTSVPWVHSAAITQGGEEVDGDEVTKIQDIVEAHR